MTGPGILRAFRLRPRPGAPMSDSGSESESLAPTLRPGRPSSGSVAFDCSRFEGTHFEAAAPAAQKCARASFCRFLDERPCTDRLLRTPARTRACRSCAARRRSRNTPEPKGADRTCSARPTLAVEGLQYRLSVYAAGAGRRPPARRPRDTGPSRHSQCGAHARGHHEAHHCVRHARPALIADTSVGYTTRRWNAGHG